MSSQEAGSNQLLFYSLHVRIGRQSNFRAILALVILSQSIVGIEIAISCFPYAFVYYRHSISSRLLTCWQYTSPSSEQWDDRDNKMPIMMGLLQLNQSPIGRSNFQLPSGFV
jgi:hypothetical protein